jgi:hypothetical protein
MLYFNDDLNDFVFLGDNIPKGIESCLEQTDEAITKDMPEEVKEGYRFGVETVMSLLRQYLNNLSEDYVVFYKQDIEIGEEMSLEELKEWVRNREEKQWTN